MKVGGKSGVSEARKAMFPLFSVGKKGKDTNMWKAEMMGKPVGLRKHFEEPWRTLYIRTASEEIRTLRL